ncbi:DNA polymerase [Vibrio sp. SCSIO 43137]|uniref:DNA polymerase n=1 Tax=Vibrio sp. SCSIO 43137 TaxID=3021011 RepID=UPI002307F652|nr:DNA polymerase [Vibrio sp. SCSIO 43137]WCE32074.1 DNA polymerase [Vibrio sp. SCSIO 43137]
MQRSDITTQFQLNKYSDNEIREALVETYCPDSVHSRDEVIADFQALMHNPVKDVQLVDNELAEFMDTRTLAPWLARRGKGQHCSIAMDSEWEYNPEQNGNDILCYSYSIDVDGKRFNGVIHTDMAKLIKHCRDNGLSKEEEMRQRKELSDKGYKLSFEDFIRDILIEGKSRGLFDNWPEYTTVFAHFMRADIASFNEFWNIGKSNKNHKNSLEVVQNTVCSVGADYGLKIDTTGQGRYKLENTRFFDKSNNAFETKLVFRDTCLLAPNKASLDALGAMLGYEKETLPPGMIERMSDLYCEDIATFNRYALRDSDIALSYGLQLESFALKEMNQDLPDGIELGVKRLPATLGNMAVSLLKATCGSTQRMNAFLGLETRKTQYFNPKTGTINTRTDTCLTPAREFTNQLAISSFMGGANFGSHYGPTEIGDYYDYDLSGAYTSALVDVLFPDYQNAFSSTRVEDYLGHTMGFAYVRFCFDKDEPYPCIPCRTDMRGIYYPRSGQAYLTAPEIAVAHNMGCKIDIQFGTVIPWVKGSEPLFKTFTAIIRDQRAKYESQGNELYSQLIKTLGNSVYGKAAQGLVERNVFDSNTGLSKKIPYSPITNAQLASHVTGFVRACLYELIMSTARKGYSIISATTDGYLTDCPQHELDLSGANCQRFLQICREVGDGEMIKLKHHVRQLIAMKTRGQLTAEPGTTKPVCAKAGKKAPKGVDENSWMVKTFLDRYPGQRLEESHLASPRDMWRDHLDLISISRNKRLNLEFDFKRCPINPRMVKVRHPETGETVEHLAFDTLPWPTVEDGLFARTYFDEWRENHCLKTLHDWYSWMDFYKVKKFTKGTGLKYTKGGSLELFRLQMLRAITQGKWGLPEHPARIPKGFYEDLAEQLTEAGFETTKKDCANARAKTRKVYEQLLPVTQQIIPLLAWLVEHHPDVDMALIFHPSELEEAKKLLLD